MIFVRQHTHFITFKTNHNNYHFRQYCARLKQSFRAADPLRGSTVSIEQIYTIKCRRQNVNSKFKMKKSRCECKFEARCQNKYNLNQLKRVQGLGPSDSRALSVQISFPRKKKSFFSHLLVCLPDFVVKVPFLQCESAFSKRPSQST